MTLTIEGLRAGYGDVEVLHGLDYRFESGTNVCIMGPNGCGKTTLIRAIAGLIPSKGQVLLNSKSLHDMPRKEIARRIAVMSQSTQASFPYTVYDTVMLGRYAHAQSGLFSGVTPKDRQIVEDCLTCVHLEDIRNEPIDVLSGGQRQRVFLAQTLAQDPQIILLDEPTNHLDVRHQLDLIDYLKRWSKQGERCVIGVLHDVNLALRLTQNVLFMQEGRIVRSGNFSRIADTAFLKELYRADVAAYMRQSLEMWRNLP